MKTTIELPDDLLKTMKVRAAREGRSLKDLLTTILRAALKSSPVEVAVEKGRRRLPTVKTSSAKPGREMTPERIAEVLWGSAE